ncbi:MAG: CHRD domain-containing protein [Bryobacteraceae bacterium]
MYRISKAVLGGFSVMLAGAYCQAATILTANISNAAENPPTVVTTSTGAPRPASFGTATFLLNDTMTAMTMSATIFNIDFTGTQTADVNDNLAAAHIHASATATTVNAPVVWGFFGSPLNDNNPDDVVVTPFTSGVGGSITGKWDAAEGNGTTLTAQLSNILSGNSYINFHTTQFGAGETRGFLEIVPEPSSTLLMSLGLAGLAAVGICRRRKLAKVALDRLAER